MGVALVLVLMACPIFAVLLAITALTPTWHWVTGFIFVTLATLTYLWVQNVMATSAPGYYDNGGLGIAIIGLWTIAFGATSVIYGLGLVWWNWTDNP